MLASEEAATRTIARQTIKSTLHSLTRLAHYSLCTLSLILPSAALAMGDRPMGSTLEEVFLATPAGPTAADANALSRVLNALGKTGEADALRRELLHEYLQHLNGNAPDPARTFGMLVERGRSRPATPPDFDTLWQDGFNRVTLIEWPDATETKEAAESALPRSLKNVAHSMTPAAPGIWRDAARSYPRLYLALRVRNTGPEPIPLFEPRLSFPGEAPELAFECSKEPPMSVNHYEGMRTVGAGKSSALLCWTQADAAREKAIVEKVDLLRRLNEQPLLSPNTADAKDMAERVKKWFAVSVSQLEQPARHAERWTKMARESAKDSAGAPTRWQASTRALMPPAPYKAPPTVADRMGQWLQPFMAGLQGILMTFVLFLLGRGLLHMGVGYTMVMVVTLALVVVMSIGGFVLMAGPDPTAGEGWAKPVVAAGAVTIFFAGFAWVGVGLLHALHRVLDADEVSWLRTIVSGWQRTLDWKSPTSRGEFWGFFAHFVVTWALVRWMLRPWDALVFLIFLPPLAALTIRRLRTMSAVEIVAMVVSVVFFLVAMWTER